MRNGNLFDSYPGEDEISSFDEMDTVPDNRPLTLREVVRDENVQILEVEEFLDKEDEKFLV